ncbi:MAG: (2Fe-2S)-binding protein [Bacteriovorax sp.]|nr:(2Fe-2S)-binding protein [Rhizobacter sp.]
MIVCVCHRVSDRDIAREVRQGCASFEALQDELRVGTGCGGCIDCAQQTFDHACARNAVMALGAGGAMVHRAAASA